MGSLKPDEIVTVSKTIELILRSAWDDDKRLAAALQTWLKGQL